MNAIQEAVRIFPRSKATLLHGLMNSVSSLVFLQGIIESNYTLASSNQAHYRTTLTSG